MEAEIVKQKKLRTKVGAESRDGEIIFLGISDKPSKLSCSEIYHLLFNVPRNQYDEQIKWTVFGRAEGNVSRRGSWQRRDLWMFNLEDSEKWQTRKIYGDAILRPFKVTFYSWKHFKNVYF